MPSKPPSPTPSTRSDSSGRPANTTRRESLHSDQFKAEKPSPFSIESFRSGAVQSRVVKGFLILSGLILTGGLFVGGLGFGGGAGQGSRNVEAARVGETPVSGFMLTRTFEQQQRFNEAYGMQPSVASFFADRARSLKQLTDQAALIEAARAAGITASPAEIDAKIDELMAAELVPQPGQTQAAFRRAIEGQFGSMEAARTQLRDSFDRDAVRDQVLVEKLEAQVKAANVVTEEDYRNSVTRLSLSQIVLRAPVGTGDPAQAPQAAQQAAERATRVMSELGQNPTAERFAAIARRESDDEATKASGGQLEPKLAAEFAAYGEGWEEALSSGQGPLVGPLEDNIGSRYVFFVRNREVELPDDFETRKSELLEAFEQESDERAWSRRQSEIQSAMTPQISDPALAAYQLQTDPELYSKTPDEQNRVRAEALERYASALRGRTGMEAAAIRYQMSLLHRELNQEAERVTALREAVDFHGEDPGLRLELARALRDNNEADHAVAQLTQASQILDETPAPPSFFGAPDARLAVRQQIAAELTMLQQTELAAAERSKIEAAQAAAAPQGFPGLEGLPPGVQIETLE